MKIPISKDKTAIVVVGYNRIKSIRRLLDSLIQAKYPSTGVPLVISIDCSGDEELYKYVRDFDWPFGEKYVNIQQERLGLKNHIFQCGDLVKYFRAIVLLEDDLFVSPFFYDYVERTVDYYGDDDNIAEISLYKNEENGYAGLPFYNIQDGCDVFLMQDVSTWGQCWTEQMWHKFVQWRDSHTEDDIMRVDMPERIKKWSRAWSKYYLAYVVSTKRHVLFPNVSLTTNFSDAGEHGGSQNSVVQVSLLQGEMEYRFRPVEELVKYDIYNNNEDIVKWLGLNKEEVCLDLYGIHNNLDGCYILSTRILPYKIKESFALNMRPIEMNIKYHVKGKGIFLYEVDSAKNLGSKSNYTDAIVPYFIRGFDRQVLWDYMKHWFRDSLLKKLRIRK